MCVAVVCVRMHVTAWLDPGAAGGMAIITKETMAMNFSVDEHQSM